MLIRAFVFTFVVVSINAGKPTISICTTLVAKNSKNSTQTTAKPAICGSKFRCCKLGQRAVRLAYTCRFEAFIQALEHQISYSHRLLSGRQRTPDRMVSVKEFERATRLMKRLGRCRSAKNKKCFQLCCESKSNDMKKYKKGGQ